ncbi:CENP-b protein 1 [Gigaspora margarita]|uniref:CENP-b protein 1 n=1 Tax=Gigaspora margarita TaxID=4874 RepID=A0A8H3X609_GIGMA|nr:CENP-b protein 1 [Gigaspora margarita]
MIERATDKQKNLEKNKEENLHQIFSSEIVDTISGLTTYINGNKVVPTEEFLDDEQIVELATQSVEFDSSSSDKELVLISHKKGLEALTTFIDYFEQQTDAEFKVEDLRTLKKYNNIRSEQVLNLDFLGTAPDTPLNIPREYVLLGYSVNNV